MVPSYSTRLSVWTTLLYGRPQETRTRVAIIREEVVVDDHAAEVASAVAVLEPTMEGSRGVVYVTSDAPIVLSRWRDMTLLE